MHVDKVPQPNGGVELSPTTILDDANDSMLKINVCLESLLTEDLSLLDNDDAIDVEDMEP
jgi:hypothetical protein